MTKFHTSHRKLVIRIMGVLFVGFILVHLMFLATTGWRSGEHPHFIAFLIGFAGICLLSGKNTGRLLAALACLGCAIMGLIFILSMVSMAPESLPEFATKRLIGVLATWSAVFALFYFFLVAPATRSLYTSEEKMTSGRQLAKPVLLTGGLVAFAIAAFFVYLGLHMGGAKNWLSGLRIFGCGSLIFAVLGGICLRVWHVLRRAERAKTAGHSIQSHDSKR